MPEPLPLFPLATILFPDMLLPLHIFEPRYRLLVRRCLDTETPFGIVLARQGDDGDEALPHRVGTSARIVGATPLPDGRSFIVVRGERRFAIESLDDGSEPYLVGKVRFLDDDDANGDDVATHAASAYLEYLAAIIALSDEVRSEIPDDPSTDTPRDLSYRIAAGLAIDEDERQRLLEIDAAAERLTAEVQLLDRENLLLRDVLVRRRARGEGPTLN